MTPRQTGLPPPSIESTVPVTTALLVRKRAAVSIRPGATAMMRSERGGPAPAPASALYLSRSAERPAIVTDPPAASASLAVSSRSPSCRRRRGATLSTSQLARIGRRGHRDVVEAGVLGRFQPAPQVPETVELRFDLPEPWTFLVVDVLVHVDRLALGLELADTRDDFVESHRPALGGKSLDREDTERGGPRNPRRDGPIVGCRPPGSRLSSGIASSTMTQAMLRPLPERAPAPALDGVPVTVGGKFFFVGDHKTYVRGVSYG